MLCQTLRSLDFRQLHLSEHATSKETGSLGVHAEMNWTYEIPSHDVHLVANALGPDNRLPADVEKFAPGWKIKNCGQAMNPGLRDEWQGRRNVLLTHPRSRDVPCLLSRRIEVPMDRKTVLHFAVNNHPKGDWTLVVRVGGEEVLAKSIESDRWQEIDVELTKHSGETVDVELENRASDWAFERAYWSQIEIHEE